jgi:hypothetical protein
MRLSTDRPLDEVGANVDIAKASSVSSTVAAPDVVQLSWAVACTGDWCTTA